LILDKIIYTKNSNSGRSPFGKRKAKRYLDAFALVTLLVAFVFGQLQTGQGLAEKLHRTFPDRELEELSGEAKIYSLGNSGEYLALGSSSGYGGPLLVGLEAHNDTVKKVHILQEKETYSFLIKLINRKFFRQFEGMKLTDSFSVSDEVEVISGATVSSVAFTHAIRKASRSLAGFTNEVRPDPVPGIWHFSWREGALILLILLASYSVFFRKRRLRYLSLGISFVFLGFILNASLSVSHFGSLLLGYLPSVHDHLIWWILMSSTLVAALFMGKNIYCSGLCPFHAAQIFLNNIGGINLVFPRSVQRIIKHTSKLLLWISLMLILLETNPTVGSYEPFALLFSLEGSGLHWYLLPAVLLGSLLVPDVFCRYFCPVGRSFSYLLKVRQKVKVKFWS